MNGYCSFVYNILLIFLSLFSLSMSILGCYKSTQLCPSQFTSNPPNTIQPPQPITTHHNTWYSNHKINQKQRKIKQKINPNPKSNLQWKTQKLRTQNQTFNKKPINPNLSAWELRWRKRLKKKKKMKRKDHGRGCRDEMWFCDYMVGVKSRHGSTGQNTGYSGWLMTQPE